MSLRDSFGVPKVKAVTGNKILRILKLQGAPCRNRNRIERMDKDERISSEGRDERISSLSSALPQLTISWTGHGKSSN